MPSSTLEQIELLMAAENLDNQLAYLDEENDRELLESNPPPEEEPQLTTLQKIEWQMEQDRLREERAASDTFVDNALDVGGEFAQAGNKTVAQTVDFFTSPVRAAMPGSIPNFEQLGEEMGMFGNDYMEEGIARDAVRGAGSVAPVAGGFVPVTRAGGSIASVGMDMAGLGMSTDDAATVAYKAAMAANKQMDKVQLATPKGEDSIWEAVKQSAKRQMVDGNRPGFKAYEKSIKQAEKDVAELGAHNADDVVTPVNTVNLGSVIDDLTARGVDPDEAHKIILKKGGIRFPDELEMDELIAMDKQFTKDITSNKPGSVGWYMDLTFTPVSNVIQKYGNKLVGSNYERAAESAVRESATMVNDYAKPIERVIRAVDDVPELNNLLLDLNAKPQNLNKFRMWIGTNLGKADLKAFDNFIGYSTNKGNEAARKLFKPGAFDFDVVHLHANKRQAKPKTLGEFIGRFGKSDSSKSSVLQQRTRLKTKHMKKTEAGREELALYDNVLVSHLKYLGEQEQLLQMAKHLKLRPSMGKKDTFDAFFKEVKSKMLRDGLSEDQADVIYKIAGQAHEGGRASPPPAIRAFMALSYGGTLAQFKTAVLNLHDIPVAMHSQGLVPTMRAIASSNKKMFGKSLEALGIGDTQSQGEFVQQFDRLTRDPSFMEKAATGSRAFTEGAMWISGFKFMDKVGKGVVLRASVNNMQRAAKRGTLHKEWGDIASKQDLHTVKKYLAERTPPAKIPQAARAIIEEMAFTALGKQQLISQAGRPLNYLKYPMARPLYALTGFAIKQRAMIAQQLREATTVAEKAKVAASYATYAGIGYGVINEARNATFKNDEFEPEGIMFGVLEQLGAVFFINKMGDAWSVENFMNNPVEFLFKAFTPPGGMTEAAAKSLTSAIKILLTIDDPDEWDDSIVEKIPALGDFYKYQIKGDGK